MITSNLPTTSYSGSLPDLRIEGITAESAVVRLFYTSGSTVYIFNETLCPDVSSRITLLGFAHMVTRHMLHHGLRQITLTLSVTPLGGSVTSFICTVYYSSVLIADTTTFNTNRFLTMCDGAKHSNLGRAERLYARSTPCRFTVFYADGTRQTGSLTYTSVVSGIYAFDLSPSNFVLSGKRPSHIIVTCGSRSQQYIIPSEDDAGIDGLVFVNAFGLKETIYFAGVRGTKPAYKRSEIQVGRTIRQYDIDETVTHEWNTGIITLPTARLVQDLCRSYDVRRISTGERVVINDCKADYDDADDSLTSLTVSWQLASDVQESEGAVSGGIFDDTFDESFN